MTQSKLRIISFPSQSQMMIASRSICMSSSKLESEVDSLKLHASDESAFEEKTRAPRIMDEYDEKAPSRPILVEHDRYVHA